MKIQDYPKQIETAALDLSVTCEALSDLRERIRDQEIEALSAVIAARTEDQKPLYSNDKAREMAVHRSLKESESYQRDLATLRTLEHKRASLEAEIERLRREYRIALIDYEREQLGRRDAA